MTLIIALFMHVWGRVALEVSSEPNILGMSANIIIIFLGYTYLKKIFRNKTFQDCRSKVIVTGLPGDLDTQMDLALSILKNIKMKQKQLELERLCSEDTPPTHDYPYYWPVHIGSQVKTRQSQSYKFEEFAITSNFWKKKLYMRHTFLSCLIRC